jgi:hypothetical protein
MLILPFIKMDLVRRGFGSLAQNEIFTEPQILFWEAMLGLELTVVYFLQNLFLQASVYFAYFKLSIFGNHNVNKLNILYKSFFFKLAVMDTCSGTEDSLSSFDQFQLQLCKSIKNKLQLSSFIFLCGIRVISTFEQISFSPFSFRNSSFFFFFFFFFFFSSKYSSRQKSALYFSVASYSEIQCIYSFETSTTSFDE